MELEINSIDQILMAEKYIKENNNQYIKREWHNSEDLERVKNIFINNMIYCNIKIETSIPSINRFINKNLLQNEYIQKNLKQDRFVNFCWSYIHCVLFNNVISDRFIPRKLSNNNEILKEHICKVPFSRFDMGIEQRKTSLLDAIQYANTTLNEKKEVVEILKTLWSHSNGREINFDWLDKNNNTHTEWAYNYISKKMRSEIPFPPQCSEDKYWAFIATIDLEKQSDLIELFLLKFKKSFSQVKYREKNKELKFYSIGMTLDTKEKLDKLVKLKDTKIHRVIEQLINDEISRISK